MKPDAITYLSDAIARIEAGTVSSNTGSHVAGIYGKAANNFEKNIRLYVATLLNDCGLDYEQAIQGIIKGPPFSKTTLGHLILVVKQASSLKPKCVSERLPGKPSGFLNTLQRVNDAWVQVKHGDEVNHTDLLTRMKFMLSLLHLIGADHH